MPQAKRLLILIHFPRLRFNRVSLLFSFLISIQLFIAIFLVSSYILLPPKCLQMPKLYTFFFLFSAQMLPNTGKTCMSNYLFTAHNISFYFLKHFECYYFISFQFFSISKITTYYYNIFRSIVSLLHLSSCFELQH